MLDPDDWIKFALKGKDYWNKNIVGWAVGSDVINFGKVIPAEINFSGFIFPVSVTFFDAQFEGAATFANAEFKGGAVFCGTFFPTWAYFSGARFNSMVLFSRAVFHGRADFRNAKFSGVAEFDDAVFHKEPLFNGEDLPGYACFNHVENFPKQFLDIKGGDAEAAYRELKKAMKRIEAHAEENAFARLEMQACQYKAPWYTKWLYWFYGKTSDYGQSILRPFIFLALSSVGFFLLYWALPQLLGNGNMPDDHISDALHLAMRKAFVFPGMFSGELSKGVTLSGWGTLLAGVHWLLSAASWFLMLLGLRNRFRLK